MTLSPMQKFLIIAAAGIVEGALLIWTGIKIDVLALGLNDHVYNIGTVILTIVNGGAIGLLVMLGLRAPTLDDVPDVERLGNMIRVGGELFVKSGDAETPTRPSSEVRS